MENTKEIDNLFEVGAHYAMRKSVRHPSMSPLIFGTKNKTEIFDLELVSDYLQKALGEIEDAGKKEKTLLFVCSRRDMESLVRKVAEKMNMPYTIRRWIGGTLTNFDVIKKRFQKMDNMEKEKAKGNWDVYTKKEKILLNKELEDLKRNFEGIRHIKKVPDYLIILDTKREHIAHTEAKKKGVPVIGIVNSNANLNDIEFPIVGNITTQKSLSYFLDKIASAYQKGKNSRDK